MKDFVPTYISNNIRSKKSLPNEKEQSGFGCNLCDWTTGETELFKALPKFGKHNSEKHSDTLAARIVYIYRENKSPKKPTHSLWRH